MNVIEFENTEQIALNGWFKNNGCGLFKSSVTCPKVEIKKANDNIDVIKSEEGFNDLMYMKPEQAARTLNKIIERITYNQELQKSKARKARGKDSIKGHNEAAKIYGEAIGEILSQFRQYALGMNGEIQKLGENKKKINGFEFSAPFYKMVLPVTARGNDPVNSVSKDELLNLLANNNASVPATPIDEKNNTALYVGIGVGVLAIAGGIAYMIKRKK